MNPLRLFILLSVILFVSKGQSKENEEERKKKAFDSLHLESLSSSSPLAPDEVMSIFSSRNKEFVNPNLVQILSREWIKEFDYSDPHRLFQSLPGVYMQEEDGFGLRPNIGLRGVSAHRSKKIGLLEDGILITPAPYSSPAAYFFPNMMKVHEIEIFKGPPSIFYGPNALGGAINFITKPIPSQTQLDINLCYGDIRKYELSLGGRYNSLGYLFEYNGISSPGFKKLPNKGKTGFSKHDFMFKGEYKLEKFDQALDLKLSYSNEKSHETYLGLTLEDFQRASYDRYMASAKDLMKWHHQQYQLKYRISPTHNIKIKTALYYHRFKRHWSKFNGFNNAVPISHYFDASSRFFDPHFLRVLKGETDSILENGGDDLVIGNNNRKYHSRGAIFDTFLLLPQSQDIFHKISIKLRYHQDQITRLHTLDRFKMRNGNLINSNQREPGTQNKDTTYAKTVFIEDEIDILDRLVIAPAIRLEDVSSKREMSLEDSSPIKKSYPIVVPGLSLQYFLSQLKFVFGVQRNMSLISPGQTKDTQPEVSLNYESGVNYKGFFQFQLLGFYNDYKNIKGFCTFSSGCQSENLDREFDGGRARIYGYEAFLGKELKIFSFSIPLYFSYTRTNASFLNDIESNNPEWGIGLVRKGDPLPYIPADKFSFRVGLKYKKLSTFFTYNWQNFVYDQSVQEKRQVVKAYEVLDWVSKYKYYKRRNKRGEFFIRLDNLLNKRYIVSFKPFGARPGKPRSFLIGWNHVF